MRERIYTLSSMSRHASGDDNLRRRSGLSDQESRLTLPDFVHEILSGSGLTFHHHVLQKRRSHVTATDQTTASQLCALNFVHLALWKDWGTKREISSLKEILSKENAEVRTTSRLRRTHNERWLVQEAVSVCNYWTSKYSTDLEEILRVPLFHLSLDPQGTTFGRPGSEGFKSLLTLVCSSDYWRSADTSTD